MHEGLWVNFVERVPLEVELQQLGTLLEETGARDARDPVLAQEPVLKNWIRTINFSAIRMKLRVAPFHFQFFFFLFGSNGLKEFGKSNSWLARGSSSTHSLRSFGSDSMAPGILPSRFSDKSLQEEEENGSNESDFADENSFAHQIIKINQFRSLLTAGQCWSWTRTPRLICWQSGCC